MVYYDYHNFLMNTMIPTTILQAIIRHFYFFRVLHSFQLSIHPHYKIISTCVAAATHVAAASANLYHPCHHILANQPTTRSIKTRPHALNTGLLNTISQHSSSHIHTHFTNIAIQKLCPNTIFQVLHLQKCITQYTHYHCGLSTLQQASLRVLHCSGRVPKENR